LDDALVEDAIDGFGYEEGNGLDKEEDSEDESSEENDTLGEEEQGDPSGDGDGSGNEEDDSSEDSSDDKEDGFSGKGSEESDESRYMFAEDNEDMLKAYKNADKSAAS
jgi:hypothetical protein